MTGITAHMILFVENQIEATEFYSYVLDLEPCLFVPGMTEYRLSAGCLLGLMPGAGIKRIIGPTLPDPGKAAGIPRAELYLVLDNAQTAYARALSRGAKKLSDFGARDWGDNVAYCLDLDGHVLALAENTRRVEYTDFVHSDVIED